MEGISKGQGNIEGAWLGTSGPSGPLQSTRELQDRWPLEGPGQWVRNRSVKQKLYFLRLSVTSIISFVRLLNLLTFFWWWRFYIAALFVVATDWKEPEFTQSSALLCQVVTLKCYVSWFSLRKENIVVQKLLQAFRVGENCKLPL